MFWLETVLFAHAVALLCVAFLWMQSPTPQMDGFYMKVGFGVLCSNAAFWLSYEWVKKKTS